MRYFVCLVLGLTIAGMIRIGVPDTHAAVPEEPLFGIGFRSWEPPRPCVCHYNESIQLTVLVEPFGIWLGLSRLHELEFIPGLDWQRLEIELRAQKSSVFFRDREDLQLAVRGTSMQPISHGTLVAAMSVARHVGFADIQLRPPEELDESPYPRNHHPE